MAMIDALTRLIVDASTFTPTDHLAKAINPMCYYNRYRDERSRSPIYPTYK